MLGDVYKYTMRRSFSINEFVKVKNENTLKRLGRPEEVVKSITSLEVKNFLTLLEILL